MRPTLCLVLGVVWVLGPVGGASAASRTPGARLPETLQVVLPECGPRGLQGRKLLEQLRVELRGDGVRRLEPVAGAHGAQAPSQVRLGLSLECAPRVHAATLWVEDVASGRRAERLMALEDVPGPTRPRALALGMAELLRSWWPPRDMAPAAPAPPPEVSSVTVPVFALAAALAPVPERAVLAPRRVRPHSERLVMRLAADVQGAPRIGGVVLGAQVRGDYGPWSLGARGRFVPGEPTRLVSGMVGVMPLLLERQQLELRAGVQLTASLPSATTAPSVFVETMAALGARLWLSDTWALSAELLGGPVLAPSLDTSASSEPVQAWLVGTSLGVGVAL